MECLNEGRDKIDCVTRPQPCAHGGSAERLCQLDPTLDLQALLGNTRRRAHRPRFKPMRKSPIQIDGMPHYQRSSGDGVHVFCRAMKGAGVWIIDENGAPQNGGFAGAFNVVSDFRNPASDIIDGLDALPDLDADDSGESCGCGK